MTDVLPDGFRCVRCGRHVLSEPATVLLDWEVSGEDDRVIVCPNCMDSGQPALDAIDSALIACADAPRTSDDNAFEADREAGVAAIATWRDISPDSCR